MQDSSLCYCQILPNKCPEQKYCGNKKQENELPSPSSLFLVPNLFEADLHLCPNFRTDANTERQCFRNRGVQILTVHSLSALCFLFFFERETDKECDLVIMSQCDALAQLITCQRRATTHSSLPSNPALYLTVVGGIFWFRHTHKGINGPMPGLEHRLSIK